MHRLLRQKRRLIKLGSRAALMRLGILFGVMMLGLLWAWGTLFQMPEQSFHGELPPLTQAEIELREALQTDVQTLATDIGPRNYSQPQQLNAAKTFLEQQLIQLGYSVQSQSYETRGQSYTNLAVERVGTENPNEIIVIGGHYDSAFNAPGADDNATGAAATLELARLFANQSTKRTVRFVEFTNEEPPFFWTSNMGSLVYAKQLKQNNENIVAMMSLEMLGYYSDKTHSQSYPFPLKFIYPNRGNFISFVGNIKSGALVKTAIAAFRTHTQFPSEGVALPAGMPGIGWSDQWSFWQQGYPGIMVTDTSFYRNPHYHTENDTSEQLDFDRFARVVMGLSNVITDLGNA